MYQVHVPVIAAAMRHDPETFSRAIMFAVLSARVQFRRVPRAMKELERMQERAPCLWGCKAGAFAYVQEHKVELWRATLAAGTDTREALRVLMAVPGLGIVKGAFVLQMLGHDVACLDTRNNKREGLRAREYTAFHKSTPGFWRAFDRYLVETTGRANELWDVWCADVAQSYGTTATAISAMHLTAIVPRALRSIAPIPCPIAANELPF